MPTGMVAAVDWPTFVENREESTLFMEELLASSIGAAEESDEEEEDLLTQLQYSQAAEAEALLVTFLQKELQAVMRLPGVPATTVGFFDLGMDSLMAVELRNRLNHAFDGEYVVSNTAIFDYPNITALARHLAEELGQAISNEAVIAPEMTVAEPAQSVDVASDNIAIIGMACRFPQANSLSEFWHLLDSGRDAFTDGRPDLEDTPAMRGAYVKGIDWFDSRFFRISPIEARTMDPQQRMLLEASWEALEDAGIDPERLRGSNTGVYAGISGSEYRDLVEKSGKSASYIGTTASVSAGRVAFALGLEGTAIAIDVACASSLAAVHQAITGLQRGEVDLALAGGVHVVLSDAISEFMIEIGMLSRSGRSRPFDASADGYVRGEGCGMLTLKRLSDAETDGDRIWAVIKGSAINQSGASAGLTVPNGPAQERVMEEALARAGISGSDVDYLEAHATGSQLGDAIEAHAIGSVYGKGRKPENPLLMGTVKSNIGHLEAAAGAAGLIKTVLALKQGTIPRHLHFDSPSPQIEWDRLPVRVTSEATEWPTHPGRPARAAVSAFGISGANAHLIIEGYRCEQGERGTADGMHSHAGSARPVSPAIPLPTGEFLERKMRLLPLSAKTDAALRDSAAQYLSWLEGRDVEESFLADMAWSASIGRSHFGYRSGVVFSDAESLRTGLRALHDTDADSYGLQPEPANRVAFLYSGDASFCLTGLGERLYDREPVVRAVLDRCDAVVRAERGVSLLNVMFNHETAAGDINDPVWAQPALYAIESALTALWSSISIRPVVVLGQGTGELAAAQAAGVFGLEDGLRFVLSRSALLSTLPGVDPNQAISGIEAAYDGVSTSSPSAPLISSFTGNLVATGSSLSGAYWRRQARERVDVGACASTLAELQVDTLIEIGPGATLSTHICSEWPQPTGDNQEVRLPSTIATMSSANGEGSTGESESAFVLAVAQAYEAGLKVDFEGLFAGESRRRVSLPTYPFQRRRHWV